jgi:hypothetical protein
MWLHADKQNQHCRLGTEKNPYLRQNRQETEYCIYLYMKFLYLLADHLPKTSLWSSGGNEGHDPLEHGAPKNFYKTYKYLVGWNDSGTNCHSYIFSKLMTYILMKCAKKFSKSWLGEMWDWWTVTIYLFFIHTYSYIYAMHYGQKGQKNNFLKINWKKLRMKCQRFILWCVCHAVWISSEKVSGQTVTKFELAMVTAGQTAICLPHSYTKQCWV